MFLAQSASNFELAEVDQNAELLALDYLKEVYIVKKIKIRKSGSIRLTSACSSYNAYTF